MHEAARAGFRFKLSNDARTMYRGNVKYNGDVKN